MLEKTCRVSRCYLERLRNSGKRITYGLDWIRPRTPNGRRVAYYCYYPGYRGGGAGITDWTLSSKDCCVLMLTFASRVYYPPVAETEHFTMFYYANCAAGLSGLDPSMLGLTIWQNDCCAALPFGISQLSNVLFTGIRCIKKTYLLSEYKANRML